ncbi:adenosylmethionine--8-amino-7-oxononanoate transaminase [Olivibacter sp. SDN3]|uniref:adenosylmethionine--8-amino-7-oxononanoate transaminase n=1 Tax=Olivibacter sp. SDN3 TaxID=2764720 RepID=UPI0016516BB5|nr:adenosylmethionine--8-amino-7-oxononanoate transaminase [Olivibacter sp. SDN3]QNL48550.1 adenosylmethionine--8-amino-7-oxononanoate transaminase [Olivibacter sp. SDN3]
MITQNNDILIKNLSRRDSAHIWHPYTQMHQADPAIPIVRGEGAYLYAADGKRYIDAISSWWVNIHGHAHPYIAEKLYAQFRQLEHVIFAGFTHPPAIALAERLLHLLPSLQTKAFFSDNGSTAVEVALKMCVQYWFNRGIPKRKVLALKDAYHGDTFGAMSVSGRSKWTVPFENFMFDVCFIDRPNSQNIHAIMEFISQEQHTLACFIYEPLVQGAAGMLMYETSPLNMLMHHCRALDVLLVQDEVFTGFGRTGKLFAANHLKEQADIMCFSKGLTGGALPLGLTTCTDNIYQAFLSNDNHKTLFHGHSFTANPLACTAALASLDLLLSEHTQRRIQYISRKHSSFAANISNHPKVKAVRYNGTIFALEWETGEETSYFNTYRNQLYHYFLNQGLLLRPLGNVIYILPPYCISDEDLAFIYQTIKHALDDLE